MIKAIIEADPEGKNISGMTQVRPSGSAALCIPMRGSSTKKWWPMKKAGSCPAILQTATTGERFAACSAICTY